MENQEQKHFLCVHGHFYQPPRENPWLEAVEIQDSAAPYHDWNERITAECYASNSASRILDPEGRVVDIVSNFAKMSFNFGPTVLSWMEHGAPETYQAILNADKQSLDWRSGHGAAIAQVYNHIIMPLANANDKRTQIVWGIRDFESRFQRAPEGMWLAETAVDNETLELLAEYNIKYTILGPHQAKRFRKIGEEQWIEERPDPTRPYRCNLPSGRSIALFFYDEPISKAIAFENLLSSAGALTGKIQGGFSDGRDWPQLLNLACDGETYGHHQKFGDMALASALREIEDNNIARITNYGEFLELSPPDCEVEINERTSWSCFHGVERWNSDCGCSSGGYPHWNQQWRSPMRNSLNWLRDRLAEGFQRVGARLFKDPWAARNAYIEVILNRDNDRIEEFLSRHGKGTLNEGDRITALKLMEMQRHALLMFTSCGWFFDELSGLETVQCIHYAARAVQLSKGVVEDGVEAAFVKRLSEAKCNVPEHRDGGYIYQTYSKQIMLDLVKVGAHYAFSSLYEDYEDHSGIYCYTIDKDDYRRMLNEAGGIALGRVRVQSQITEEKEGLLFSVVRIGSHDFKGGVVPVKDGQEQYQAVKEEMTEVFDKGLYTELIGLMDKHFGHHSYSINNLFQDEKRKILGQIIAQNMLESVESYQSMFEHGRPLLDFLQDTGMPIPKLLNLAAQPALNASLKRAFTEEDLDVDEVQHIVEQIRKWQVGIEYPDTEFYLRRHMEKLTKELTLDPDNLKLMTKIERLMELLKSIPLDIELWQVQNHYYAMAKTIYPQYLERQRQGDEEAGSWVESFRRIGEHFRFNLDAVLPAQ